MHPTAARSLTWGIVLLVAGALIVGLGTHVYSWTLSFGSHGVADLLLRVASTTAYLITPLGAALVGAAVVITALAPRQAPAAVQEE